MPRRPSLKVLRRLLPRRRSLRLLLFVCSAVLLLFVISNIVLSSAWFTGLLAEKVSQRSGVPCQVDRISWSPWSGLNVRGVKLYQPGVEQNDEGRGKVWFSVDRIQVIPYWGRMLRGELSIRQVTVDSPDLYLSVEFLQSVLSRVLEGKPVTPSRQSGAVAGSPGGSAKQTDAATKKPVDDASDVASSSKGGESPSTKRDKEGESSGARRTQLPEPSRPDPGLPLLLCINDARLRLAWDARSIRLFEVEGVDLEISLLGDDVQGNLEVASVRGLGMKDGVSLEKALGNMMPQVKWRRPYLQWQMNGADIAGVRMDADVKLLLAGGTQQVKMLPFVVDLQVQPQVLNSLDGLDCMAMHLSGGQIQGRLRAAGWLRHPASWRAEMEVLGRGWRLSEDHGHHDVLFDEVRVPAVFRGGELQWAGVRFVGEDISILANGRISPQRGVMAVTRLVVSPEVSEMVGRGLHGAGLTPNTRAWWQDLDTPDRKVRDLLLSGSLANPVVDAGHQHREIPVWEILGKTLGFVRQEMREEGVRLRTLPSLEPLEQSNEKTRE